MLSKSSQSVSVPSQKNVIELKNVNPTTNTCITEEVDAASGSNRGTQYPEATVEVSEKMRQDVLNNILGRNTH